MAGKKKAVSRKRMIGAYLSSIFSISLVLILVGVATLLLANARKVSDYFKESLQVSLLLTQDVTDEQALEFADELKGMNFVREVKLIDREQGAQELKDMLGEDFLDVFESSPVPISIDINLVADYVQKDSLNVVKEKLSEKPIVENVECRQALFEELSTNMTKIYIIILVLLALLLFISIVLINNVVRLNLQARKFSVHTMQLVGATRSYIRRPFMAKAALQGFAASLIALGALAGFLYFVKGSVPQIFNILTPRVLIFTAGVVVLCGLLICLGKTFLVMNKLLSLSKDELYG